MPLYNSIYHFGGTHRATPGYTDPLVFDPREATPYGVSRNDGTGTVMARTGADLAHAEYLGKRVTELAKKVRG